MVPIGLCFAYLKGSLTWVKELLSDESIAVNSWENLRDARIQLTDAIERYNSALAVYDKDKLSLAVRVIRPLGEASISDAHYMLNVLSQRLSSKFKTVPVHTNKN